MAQEDRRAGRTRHLPAGGIDPSRDMRWTEYALAMLWFNGLGGLIVYALQRLQAVAAAQSPVAFGGLSGFRVQYGDELHHEHQLAGLRG